MENWPSLAKKAPITCAAAGVFCQSAAQPDAALYWFFTGPPGVTDPYPWEWTLTATRCLTSTAPTRPVPALTATDFRRLPLPPARITVEPGSLRTLINIPTNVLAGAPPVILTTTLLGQPIRVRATATTYHWTFGDGTSLTTTDPGAHYPDLRTTHTYLDPGRYTLSLTTTYTGEYSITAGPWLPIDGTAQVISPPVQLTAFEAHAHLVLE